MLKSLKIQYLKTIFPCQELSMRVKYDENHVADLTYQFSVDAKNIWVFNWVENKKILLPVSKSIQYQMCNSLVGNNLENINSSCSDYETYIKRYFPQYEGLYLKKTQMIFDIISGIEIHTPCLLNIRKTYKPNKVILNDGAHRAAVSLLLNRSVKIGF